jgi:Domain of unknown function (DUF1707)/Cell wall-active antibiotics response 4TMS YvqF
VSDELDVRVSDAERERVALSLREHCAAGRLTLEELSTRLDEAYRARTGAELEAALRELPAQPATRSRRSPKHFSIAIFSGVERKGRWRVPRRSFSLSLFGGTDLDLRHAEIDAETVTIFVVAIFGGTDLYVPEGVDLDVGGFALFGGLDEHGGDAPAPVGAPLVRVRALALFGGADVWRVPHGAEGSLRQVRRLARGSS